MTVGLIVFHYSSSSNASEDSSNTFDKHSNAIIFKYLMKVALYEHYVKVLMCLMIVAELMH